MLGNSVSRACEENGASSPITDSEKGGASSAITDGGASSVSTDRDMHMASSH